MEMKPVDKFGTRIHPSVFKQLSEFGEKLRDLGYSESRTKANLFYHSPTGGIAFFMDMRGTSVIDIAEDTRPLFYWNIDLKMEDWAKRRLLKEERERLAEHGVPLRLSGARHFSSLGGTGPGDKDYLADPFGAADGYCVSCGSDFSDSGYYCSEDCERKERPNRFCRACKERVSHRDTIRHHVRYFPEEIVIVCRSCHNKIHFSDQYPELTPPEEEIRRFYDEEEQATSEKEISGGSISESTTTEQKNPLDEEDRGWEDIFPFDPRPAQRDGIETALPVLDRDGYVILEGACGTGKTIMSLTAAIDQIVNGDKERLVVITPLKQQQQQFVEDLREINQNLLEHERLNGLALVGKKEVCPYSRERLVNFSPENVQSNCSTLRRDTRETFTGDEPVAAQARRIVDDSYVGASNPDPDPNTWPGIETADSWSHFSQSELPRVDDTEVCPFYAQHYAYEKQPRFGFSSAPNHVFSGKDLVRTAVDENYCPHSAMYALINRANVLIANYTHLFNDGVRNLLDDFIDKNTLLIIDEAHNLEPRVRNTLDRTKALSTLQAATDDIEALLDNGLIQIQDIDDEIAPELTRRDLERADDCLSAFIDAVVDEVSEYIESEYSDWQKQVAKLLQESDDRLDYMEEPDDLRKECRLPYFEEMSLQDLEKNEDADYITQSIAEVSRSNDEKSPLACLVQVSETMEKAINHYMHNVGGDGESTVDPFDTSISANTNDSDVLSTPFGRAAIERYQQWMEEEGHYTDTPELSTLGWFAKGWNELDSVSHVRLAELEWDWSLQNRQDVEEWTHSNQPAWKAAYRATLTVANCVPEDRICDELAEFGGGIVMSATLEPMDVFREVTGLDELEEDRPVVEARYTDPGYPLENRATFIVDSDWYIQQRRGGMLQEKSEMTPTRREFAELVVNVARTHGNLLVVMPSYDEAEWARDYLNKSSLLTKEVLLDQASTNKETEELKQSFFRGPHKVLVTSSHGTLIEGVDYDGEKLHTVLICGIPIRGGLRTEAVQRAYDYAFDGSGFEYALLVPAVRQSRQAIGRVIRGPEDVGTRILADGRYAMRSESTAFQYLSKREQEEATVIDPNSVFDSIDMFWRSHSK